MTEGAAPDDRRCAERSNRCAAPRVGLRAGGIVVTNAVAWKAGPGFVANRRQTEERTGAGKAALAAVPADDDIGQRIVQAAADAIIDKGFGGATTDTIARAARTSKRAIYERFPDRDALFEKVMALLCAQAGQRPNSEPEKSSLEEHLHDWAMAVLLRFTHPTGRRVFAAAVAARPSFPTAIEVFWEHGPGVAVEAIAERLRHEKRQGRLGNLQPGREARRFMLSCCGPVVLEQLVDRSAEKSRAALERHVAQTVAEFLQRIRD